MSASSREVLNPTLSNVYMYVYICVCVFYDIALAMEPAAILRTHL